MSPDNNSAQSQQQSASVTAPRWLYALAALGLAAALYPKLAFPASVLCFIGGLSLPKLKDRARALGLALLGAASVLSALGLLRFVLLEAIPGVVAGGQAAVEKQAVSYLRGIVTAQDFARKKALLDPDGDGVGSALSLAQLSGNAKLPGKGTKLTAPPLALQKDQLVEAASGPVISHAGYLFMACIPRADGGYSSAPEPKLDAEKAETRYLLYAWPRRAGAGTPQTVYFADEHERILLLAPGQNETSTYHGLTRPPACTAALDNPQWSVWKEKQARDKLPGAETASR